MRRLDSSHEIRPKKLIINLRIIFFALLFGLFIFLILVILFRQRESFSPRLSDSSSSIMQIVALVYNCIIWPVVIFLRLLVPRILGSIETIQKAAARFFSTSLIAICFCEGVGFFSLIVAVFCRDAVLPFSLFAVSVILMFLHFPTEFRFTNTYEEARKNYLAQQEFNKTTS